MTRVQSQRTRQALLVVGTALEVAPAPEKLELFTEDGLPVDVGKDRTRARWRGTWSATPVAGAYETNDFVLDDDKLWILADAELLEEDPTAPSDSVTGAWVLMTVSGGMQWMGEWDIAIDEYKEGSVVTWENGLWVAPGVIVDNIEPGFVVDPDPPADLFVSRAVQFTEADRFNSEDDVLFEINAETGHDNDISSGLGAIIYIDKSGATSGAQLILTPIARVGDSDSFNASAYYPSGDLYRPFSSGTEDDTATDAHTPLVLPIEDGTEDLAYHIFFGGGQYGSFNARVSDNTNLVAPPVIETPPVTWESMLPDGNLPSGGTTGQVLTKQSDDDGDADWEDSAGGGGGTVEAWREVGAGGQPAYSNSWAAHGSADYKPSFRKRPDGTVEFRGLLVNGTTDAAAFTLPVGYRPSAPGNLSFSLMAAAVGTGNPTPVRLDVTPGGDVVPYISGSAIVWLAIAGIRFATD